jgi:hypothetical protein
MNITHPYRVTDTVRRISLLMKDYDDPREQPVAPRLLEPMPPANLFAIHPATLEGGRRDRRALLAELLRLQDAKGYRLMYVRYHEEDPEGFPLTLMEQVQAEVRK